MKKTILFLLVGFLSLGAFSQTRTHVPPKQQSNAANKNKKTPTRPGPTGPALVQLPTNSNDCFFAVELRPDYPAGHIAAPKGAGYVMEIIRDAKNHELFEVEHNTIWYTFTAPYSSKLLLDIVPENASDDYDFLLYKATDQYICNKIENKRVKPILSNLSAPNAETKGAIGINLKGDKKSISKKSTEAYTSSINVVKGEVYYLVIDNLSPQSKSYKINLNFHIDGIKPSLRIIDERERKAITADVLIIEKGSDKHSSENEDRIVISKKDFQSSNIVLVPNYNYSIYVKKEGYFSYTDEFNSSKYLHDTVINIPLRKIVKGTIFPITNVYFDDEWEILPEFKEALTESINLLKVYPTISIDIKGYINPYERSIDESIMVSKKMAESVMSVFIENGVEPSRIKAIGMTQKETKEILNNYLVKNEMSAKKIEIIIHDVK